MSFISKVFKSRPYSGLSRIEELRAMLKRKSHEEFKEEKRVNKLKRAQKQFLEEIEKLYAYEAISEEDDFFPLFRVYKQYSLRRQILNELIAITTRLILKESVSDRMAYSGLLKKYRKAEQEYPEIISFSGAEIQAITISDHIVRTKSSIINELKWLVEKFCKLYIDKKTSYRKQVNSFFVRNDNEEDLESSNIVVNNILNFLNQLRWTRNLSLTD